ncbi:hypothetical protein [Plesiomonas shigelloides]|uniref:hypothetical protein n=1 Tax=Plesiomonas shigelloides TaxID=703 RepID=UPI001E575E78|nr:hypothetical protein [Plesiomonas shigelloides]
MNIRKHVIAALIPCFLITGCSSIIHGTSEKLTVNSAVPNTKIYVDGALVGNDGAMFTAKRGEDYTIKAVKTGCESTTVMTSNTFDATSLLGILIDFGIISIPIDLISGAAWKPTAKVITVNPVCPVISE